MSTTDIPNRGERLAHYMHGVSGATVRQYVKSRASSLPAYLMECFFQMLFSWIPGIPGLILRSFFYRFLFACGAPFSEPGAEFFYMNRMRFGQSVYIDRGCRLHASAAEIEIGNNNRIMTGAYLCSYVSNAKAGEGIKTGSHCWIGIASILASGQGGIILGDNVLVGPHVRIITGDHAFEDSSRPSIDQAYTGKPILIDRNTWIGAGATILGGVHIGEHAVVAAGAVVTKDVESYTVVGGVPAQMIKKISRTSLPS